MSFSTGRFIENDVDPAHTDGTRFEDVSDPAVAWDRFGNVFVTYTEHHTDNTAGEVVVRKFAFSGSPTLSSTKILYSWFKSTQAANPNIAIDNNLIGATQGTFQDPLVPGAAGKQTDPVAQGETDKDHVRVVVTWNTIVVDTGGTSTSAANPNTIIMRFSSDGGATYSGPMLVNSDEYTGSAGSGYTYSKTIFSTGRAGEAASGGRMTTVYTSNTGGPGNQPTVKTDTVNFATSPTEVDLNNPIDGGTFTPDAQGNPTVPLRPPLSPPFNTLPLGIDDAIDNTNPDIDTPVTSRFIFTVTAAQAATLFPLNDVSIALDIQGSTLELKNYSAVLIAPNGAKVTLFTNRTDEAGNDADGAFGISGNQLGGTGAGESGDANFTDSAFYPIASDTPGAASPATKPYNDSYLPEGSTLTPADNQPGANLLHVTFGGLTAAQITGQWRLEITDHRASNTGTLFGAALHLVSGIGNGAGLDRGTPGVTTVAANPLGHAHPTLPAFAPVAGLAPNIALATDNTYGAFSPFQNRVYLAYNDGSTVKLLYSDGVDATGGQLWNTAPITAGNGYLPEIYVDQTTGTLNLAYYTTSFDASKTRSTMVMQTAVNQPDYKDRTQQTNPLELSAATFITPNEQVFDQISSQTINTEPVPSNGTVSSDPRMWGNTFGLYSSDGRVNIVYPGNLDVSGTQLRTQNIEEASGPRVVGGDMGPVLGTASVTPLIWQVHTGTPNTNGFVAGKTIPGTPISYNPPSPTDGRNTFSAFVVTFDRVIAVQNAGSTASVFTPNDVKVIFRGPTNDPVGPGTNIPVQSVVPLDDIRDPLDDSFYGSKRFLVRLATPQTAVGTYSYLIGSHTVGQASLIQDRVRGPIIAYTSQPPAQSFNPPPSQQGVQIQDFTGVPQPATSSLTVPAGAFGAGVIIGDVNVTVNINHTDVGDLQLDLISPAGQDIRLVNQGDTVGLNYVNTTFDDQAGQTLAQANANGVTAPYTGSFRPVQRLAALFAANPAGTWTLVATDLASGDSGTIQNWTLTIQGTKQALTTSNGNFFDQNANGVSNEAPFLDPNNNNVFTAPDGFAVPNPVNAAVPFQLPYVTASLPITIPGPRLISTNIPGQVASSTDNLVLNKPVNSINLTFDRTIDGSMFNPKNIVRMTGVVSNQFPTGDIPLTGLTVTPIDSSGNALPAGTNSQFFKIGGFPAVSLSGTYTVQIVPQVLDPVSGQPVAQIKDLDGNLLDTNSNAGVGNLVGTVTGATVVTTTYTGTVSANNPVSIPAKGSVTIPLNVTDAYQLKKAAANISVLFPANNYRDLVGRLVAPDGTSVLLFSQAPTTGPGDMTNITLTDDSFFINPLTGQPTPISAINDGVQANGTFNPTQPFQPLINHASQGTWKLVIQNNGTVATGTVTKFNLFLDKPVISSGLGEPVADRTTASFRIAQVDGTQAIAQDNWTPIGPAPQQDFSSSAPKFSGTNSTAGRVSSIAVDPSDPSGNTVYAAGASGGVWRTNNFMTRDPDGPNWVPLTDFGPNSSINVGFLAVYNSPTDPNTGGDPNKSVVLVGTGSSSLDVIDASDQRTFDGVGFLLSEDAGKTWQVLDSTDNYNTATQSYRPLMDPGSTSYPVVSATENGNTVTITTNATFQNPHEFKAGMTVKVSGVGVAGYNGTFLITAATATTFSYTDPNAGLAASSGGTAIAVDRRDHLFVGADINKIVYEQNPSAQSNRPIIWAAISQGSDPNPNVGGLWRSTDGARTWTQVFQGNASDFLFAPGSQQLNSGDRPTFAYLAIEGGSTGGVYFTSDLNAPNPSFSLMAGGVGRPTVQTGTIGVGASPTPNGDNGKIALAAPALVQGSPLANNYLQQWLYVAVANKDGTLDGLFMTKDRGLNWTQVKLTSSFGFNDTDKNVDPTMNPGFPGGNHSLSLAVDPTNPNIVYLGSDVVMKVDTTLIQDPYNLTMYTYDDAAGGVRFATSGGAVPTDQSGNVVGGGLLSVNPATLLNSITPNTASFEGTMDGDPRKLWNFINLVRDPYRPFQRDTSIHVAVANGQNTISSFTNDGGDVGWTIPGDPGTSMEGQPDFYFPFLTPASSRVLPSDFSWVSQIFSFVDPLTGVGRVVVGTDEGITTYAANSDGSAQQVNGFNQDFQVPNEGFTQTDLQITGKRNGNLQVARLYSGDAQPSLLAAQIADSLAYGAARRYGDAQVSPADPSTGAIQWDDTAGQVGRPSTANYIATDQTGTGNVYILRRINDLAFEMEDTVDFFQVSLNGGTPISRTNGLFQNSADAQGAGQWTNQVKTFAVNPIDPSAIIMGSAAGRLFHTVDMGLNWTVAGDPSALDGSMSTALAFGAPTPNATDLDQYMYYGSANGNIFVTTDAGGNNGTSWLNITTGSWGGGGGGARPE
jgi:subtilisin-like proprotein convertase family protein